MKTLNEVIKTLELCSTDDNPCDKCPYTKFDKNGVWACSMCGDFAEDALHYLKLFQIDQTFAKQLENPPLTWDELRNMEGKPVWVVRYDNQGMWDIYKGESVVDTLVIAKFAIGCNESMFSLGISWFVYRNEINEKS